MKNVEILTEKLKQEINDLGGSLYPMVPFNELKHLVDHIKVKYDIDLPDGYKKILGIMDGFNFDGVFLYRGNVTANYNSKNLQNILESNEEWQSNEGFDEHLFYADSDMYLFVQSLSDKSFSYRSRERFEDVIFATKDNELFFEIILKLALGENIEEEYSN